MKTAPIDPEKWKETPFVSGRPATEQDVRDGKAVFYLQPSGNAHASVHHIRLPACALLRDEETGLQTPIIVIQAEVAEDTVVVGYRNLPGGNGVCTLQELQFIEEPNAEFWGAS